MKAIFVILALLVIVGVHVLLKVRDDFQLSIRDEVLASIKHCDAEASVVVDGKTVSQPEDIIHALSNLAAHRPHHSHPEETFSVIIRKGAEVITLKFGRDSEIKDEYWVSVLKEKSGEYIDVGSLRTDVFDQYL